MQTTKKQITYNTILTSVELLIKLVNKYPDFDFCYSEAFHKRENTIYEYMNDIVEFTEEQNHYISKCIDIERLQYYYNELTNNLAFKVKFTHILKLNGQFTPTDIQPNKYDKNIIYLGFCPFRGAHLFSTLTPSIIGIFQGEFLTK